MALIKCSECGKDVSDKATTCPNCGNPLLVERKETHHETRKETASESKKNSGWWIAVLVVIGAVVLIGYMVKAAHRSSGPTTTQQTTNATSTASSNVQSSVVGIYCNNNEGGSGTMFTTDGTVLTNNHVVTGATSCQVTIPNPTTGAIAEIYEATPVITPTLSKKYDIATLKIDGSYTDASGTTWGAYPTTFTAFTLPSTCNTSTASQLGDSVKIYGYPITSGELNLTETDGIVSSFAANGDILTSAKIDSGNSGGLAVDQNGCWLGIPSAVVSGNYQNLGVIIPGSVVENIMSSVPAKYEPAIASSGASALVAAITASTPQETNAQICQSQYGQNSIYAGHAASNGSPYCTCENGYAWDSTGDSCATQLSIEQSCQNSYGVGSYAYEDGGKAVCGCSTGYQWNSDQTACVVVQETPNQICEDNYGSNSEWSGQTNNNGGPTCQCQPGYVWNDAQTECVSPPSCPAFSSYDPATTQCECDSGYIASDGICESATTYCEDSEGYGAMYDSDTNSCACESGYTYNDGQCELDSTYCENTEGYGATYDSVTNSCTCDSGYIYNGSQCEEADLYCSNRWGVGAEYDYATDQCACEPGYESNGSECIYAGY